MFKFERWFNDRARPGDCLENIKFRDGEAIVPKCQSKGEIHSHSSLIKLDVDPERAGWVPL